MNCANQAPAGARARARATHAADWPALLPDVARRLLGEPTRIEHGGDTWRYRKRGSLSVHVGGDAYGTWHDFEADDSGGTLGLVEHVLGCDRGAALRWLTDADLIAPRNGAPGPDRRASASATLQPAAPTRSPKRRADPRPSRTAPLADAILKASEQADDTPARSYLARGWTWPPADIGPDLPAAVRWCPAAAVPAEARLPAEAAGALVFRLTRPDVRSDLEQAVSLEALTAAGERTMPRWRRTFGTRTGRVFEVPVAAGGAVVLVEGERDALAVALALRAGCIRSVGGTAGYRRGAGADLAGRPVMLVPDADHAGVAAVTRLLLPGALPNRSVRVVRAAEGDPAAWLAAWLTERAGIREHDGAMPGPEADHAAWRDLQAAADRGEPILFDLEADHD